MGSCLFIAKPSFGASVTENSWVSKAPMPTARGYLGVAEVNGKIYAIGGSGPIGANEEYDPETDTWTTKAPMPIPEQSFAIAAYQNKIYCIGGIPTGSTGVSQVYDPATDSWETKAPMPTGRYGLQANVVDGKIYLIGGVNPNLGYNKGVQPLNVTEVYDPSSNTWSTKAPMPNTNGYVSAVINNKIYIIGSGLNQIYNPKTNTWSEGAPTPVNISAGGANGVAAAAAATTGVMAPKEIYVYDGSYLQVYNPQNNSWTLGADPPVNRQYLAIAVVNDMLYFIGGFTDHLDNIPGYFGDYSTNEQYTPFGYGTIPPESQQEPFPTAFAAASGAAIILVGAGTILYLKKYRHKAVSSE
jgi:N-acetylneuraminic acid mutarotase